MSLLLTACSIQSVEEYEKQQTPEQSIKEQPIDKTTEPSPTIEATKKNTDVTETPKPPTAIAETPEKKSDTTMASATTPVDNDTTQKKTAAEKQAPVAPPVAEKKRYVTIGIYVKTLLTNKDLLDPSLQTEKYVPSNGIVLKATTYELLNDDDTVWDILVRATKEHKIHLEYQGANDNAYQSVYIEGINHLYEFSAGELSGWMYSVNGTFPKNGSSQYTLKDGDTIEWHYTVDLGRDLGQQVTGS